MQPDDRITCQTIVTAYLADKQLDGKPTINQSQHWRALAPAFAAMAPDDIDKSLCRRYERDRLAAGVKPGTVWSELTILRAMLNWGEDAKVIPRAPKIWMPPKPEPRDTFLTRADVVRLLDACKLPHLRLFVVLGITTAGRMGAILDLTWDRVDFEHGIIDLHNPNRVRTKKGRATVPMNATARAALQEARSGALTPYVIEWAAKPVASVKKALAASFRQAGLVGSAHTLRHSAARFMAEDGVDLLKIANLLGHSTPATTYRVYARFSPGHLAEAAAALELPAVRRVGSR